MLPAGEGRIKRRGRGKRRAAGADDLQPQQPYACACGARSVFKYEYQLIAHITASVNIRCHAVSEDLAVPLYLGVSAWRQHDPSLPPRPDNDDSCWVGAVDLMSAACAGGGVGEDDVLSATNDNDTSDNNQHGPGDDVDMMMMMGQVLWDTRRNSPWHSGFLGTLASLS